MIITGIYVFSRSIIANDLTTSSADYSLLTSSVTFAPSDVSKIKQIQLFINDDQIVETAESVVLTPSTTVSRVNTTSTAILILDNDGKDEAENDRNTHYYIVVIVILAVLLVIFVLISVTYCFWRKRRKLRSTKQANEGTGNDGTTDTYEYPDIVDVNYEDVDNDLSMYADLNRSAVDTEHVYCHLNEVPQNGIYENESVM